MENKIELGHNIDYTINLKNNDRITKIVSILARAYYNNYYVSYKYNNIYYELFRIRDVKIPEMTENTPGIITDYMTIDYNALTNYSITDIINNNNTIIRNYIRDDKLIYSLLKKIEQEISMTVLF
jgi:hypothetical protein